MMRRCGAVLLVLREAESALSRELKGECAGVGVGENG